MFFAIVIDMIECKESIYCFTTAVAFSSTIGGEDFDPKLLDLLFETINAILTSSLTFYGKILTTSLHYGQEPSFIYL